MSEKICPNCGESIKKDWEFCPHCGEKIESETRKKEIFPFGSIFDDIEKEFERIDKMFGFDFLKFPSFKMKPGMRSGGISITIQSGTGMKPKVEIKTSGEYKKLEPELKRKLGIKPAIEEVEEEKTEKKKHEIKSPKITEEPESEVQTVGNKQIISIKLPDVKSEDDIDVKRLEQSIEVKAFAGDKAYFKLIPIPTDSNVSKKFKDGILKIEIER
ncbi:MAG: zinc ribbon domain-containing protein [Candidatus Aenigmatarchaeota archaeon]|nr:zinc ribbon domain-containing protein [Candidatus Aenigmarchaeota archaeon]